MELIYSMRRKPLKCLPPHFENSSDAQVVRPICTISTANIIAFSSPTELSDSDGSTWGGHVYVCDLDTPWDSHKVTSTSYPVSTLEWDNEGKQLLVATTDGDVSVFGQKDYLLNEWQCLYMAQFPGEHVIKAVFFHNGRRFLVADKKPDAPISERIQLARFMPTLKGFGGVACEGCIILTATGLLAALTPPAALDSNRAQVASESLRGRHHVICADFAHKSGSVVAAAAARGAVRVYACAPARAAARPPALRLQALPTIFLPTHHTAPVSISWCLREDSDSLLVATNKLTLWKLTERSHPVHKLLAKGPLQGSTTPGGGQKQSTDCYNTVVWQQAGAWAEGGALAGGARVPPALAARAPPAPAAPLAALGGARALHLLARDQPHYICSRAVVTSGCGEPAAAATPPKKTKYGAGALPAGWAGAVVAALSVSALGGACVCVDSHAQLHLYRLPQPWTDMPSPMSLQQATSILEYSMVSGYDCLDVLLTLKPNMMETVYERLTENFQRQPQHFQQYYYHSWLKLRMALCRNIPSWQSSASWLTCLSALSATAAASSAALRPDERPERLERPERPDDAPPHTSAALAALLDDLAPDPEKILLNLEAKTDVCSEALSLQALRRPLQRTLDLALTVLAAVPHHHQTHGSGYDFITDPSAMSLLRKMVVVVRASGRGGEALSRPLARLAASAQAKQDLIEECASLCAAATSARAWEAAPRCSVSAPHMRHWPFYLEYGVEPEALRYTPEPPAYAQGETTPSTTMDSIRYMYLGGGSRPARWRQCARCGARALALAGAGAGAGAAGAGAGAGAGAAGAGAAHARHPLQRAHDARFLHACRCGGKWTLFSNI